MYALRTVKTNPAAGGNFPRRDSWALLIVLAVVDVGKMVPVAGGAGMHACCLIG